MIILSESYARLLRKSLAVVFVAFALMVISSTFSPSPAHAASATCPGPCINTAIDVAIHSSSSGTGSLGGSGSDSSGASGGSSAPPAVQLVCQDGNTDYCITTPQTTTEWVPEAALGLPGPCPAKQVNGFTINYVGIYNVTVYDFAGWIGQGSASWSVTKTSVCIYPPDPVIDNTTYNCIISWNAHVDRSINSYSGRASGVASTSGTTTFANGGMKDPSSCETSKSAALNYVPPTGQPGWGQYSADSSIIYVSCTKASTSFGGAVTSLIKCGGAQTKNSPTTYLTVWCGGYSPSLLNMKWSGEDCYSAGVATCTAPSGTSFNGFTGNVQALRDGNDGIVKWANPVFSGNVRSVNSWRVKTTINNGSTPYNSSVSANDKSSQLFRSDQSFGSWIAGNLNTLQQQKLAFYTSGSSGSPFSMTRNYLYNAQFLTHDVIMNQIDLLTGRISASTVNHWNTVVNSSCGPQSSPSINAVRAIGDVLTQ
jgi:hypothetical protein